MALSTAEIKQFISDDITSEKKRMAAVGQKYYEAEHDILNCRLFYYNSDGNLVEDKTRSNIKICHPFFTELADQLSYHLLSFKENPIRADDNAEGLQDYFDSYFNARFWREIGDLVTGAYAKGFEYLYGYKNSQNRTAFECADSMGVVEVRAKDAEDGQDHIIYWYIDRIEKGRKAVKRIQDWTANEILYYVQVGNGKIVTDQSVPINPRPHVVFTEDESNVKKGYGYGFIPFWRLDNNRKQFSGLKPIKGAIDDYDRHACALSNNLADFDTPLYVVSGFNGDNLDELQQNLKTKKIVGVDSEGGIDVKTVDIPYQARKEKLDINEQNIYRFGMGFNSAQVGDGNITNVVIQSRYALLEMKAKKMQDRLCALLEEIIPIVLDEINAEHEKAFTMDDVYFDFSRDTITNESENIANDKVKAETQQIQINTILNIAAQIGDEETLKAICDVMELDYEDIKDKVPQPEDPEADLNGARVVLEGVVTNEQKAMAGTETIPE